GDAEAASATAPRELAFAVLPFRVHAGRNVAPVPRPFAELLGERLATLDDVRVVGLGRATGLPAEDAFAALSDAELRRIGREVGADAVVTGSLTQLAGRLSVDVRVTPTSGGARARSLVFTAASGEDLLAQLPEVASRVAATFSSGEASPRVAAIQVLAPPELEQSLRARLRSKVGEPFDPLRLRDDREALEADARVGSASVETRRTERGVELVYRVVPAEMLLGGGARDAGDVVAEVRVEGNRRIEADAIRTRIRTREGEPLRETQVAADVRDVFALGFFRDVRVYTEPGDAGVVLTFDVTENPVVRQISLSGNDEVDSDDIREALTLTTGSTLDYPLLHENEQRIEALYRAQGFYLAKVESEVDEVAEGSVGILFRVNEGEKQKLRTIEFEGNEAFDDDELADDFNVKTWKFYSLATSWFDKTGTYSEPIFLRDLRSVEKKYTDAGYLQVEIGDPEVAADEDGLRVTVPVYEGPQFSVGALDVAGDETVDLEALRERLRLSEKAVFNRSYLTADVESLERYYTDRGFYFAKVEPLTRLDPETKTVDVQFHVEKGPLYFIRHIDVSGNTRTVDPVVRNEMRIVEGQLYSARAIQISQVRARNLGFFEDVAFEPRTTADPSQLDLDVTVAERPTGSFSFGAGFSSQDRLVLTASLSQANLFGLGLGVNLSADIGGRTNRFFFSYQDPYFFDSQFSFGTTVFLTDVRFQDFEQRQAGFDLSFGHPLSEDNTSRLFLRYGYSQRRVRQDTGVNAAAVIFREILQRNESSSTIGASYRSDTRDDRFSPVSGDVVGLTLDYSGLGGFTNFLRIEGRYAHYFGAPDWLPYRSTFVFSTRAGWAIPFNTIDDFDFDVNEVAGCQAAGDCVNVNPLSLIDTDVELPLTERYFLGGVGAFQLRGFRARSVGPRRAILRRSGAQGQGDLFLPVGREVSFVNGQPRGVCNDQRDPSTGLNFNQGNRNGVCNDITDREIDDFEDLNETDVVGGNKFIASSFEYRFPISEEVGLQGVVFADMGNAFDEKDDNLFDVTEWRYGVGGGVLWFSPFGPLQLVLGFPLDPLAIEDSPVFEFSVGGAGL
ncbi:MAG: outer membrane protein assembly factor BamA, partial [Myxococcales bacterium]|nr:outer membrane protein assembly factor BamA [Myxococcales bacterium]